MWTLEEWEARATAAAASDPNIARARVPLLRPNGQAVPYKFSEATAKIIVDGMRTGAHLEVAAAAAGVSRVTVFSWRKMGREDGSGPLFDFAEGVRVAQAMAELENVAAVAKAGRDAKTWQAAAWLLQRRSPERWGEQSRQHVEVTGAGGGPVEVEHSLEALSDAELQERIAATVLSTPGLREAVAAQLKSETIEREPATTTAVAVIDAGVGLGVPPGDER